MFAIQYPELYINYYSLKADYATSYRVSYAINGGTSVAKREVTVTTSYGTYRAYILDMQGGTNFKTIVLMKDVAG
jgi:hypothetical protein